MHAQDRLWQMDFLRRLAAGRLSEVLGERTRSRSTGSFGCWGLHRLARQAAAMPPERFARGAHAYADGVNALPGEPRSGPAAA